MYKIVFLLMLFVISTLNATVTLTNNLKKYEHFEIQYFYDKSSLLDIKDIEKTQFTETVPSQFTLGYREGSAWFKIEINNKSDNEDFILYFTEAFWSKFDLYTKINGSWSIQKNGLDIDLKDRRISDNSPAFKIYLSTNQSSTYYVKGKTISGHIGEFQIFTEDEYFRPSRLTITEAYIIFSAFLFVIILLNIYNMIITKDRIYMYYILYVFTFIIFIYIKSALYLSAGLHGWSEGLHTVGALLVIFLLLFSGRFLEIKKNMPATDRLFKISAVILSVFVILVSQNIPYSNLLFNIFSLLFFTLLFITSVRSWLNGSINARYYLIALMFFTPAMGLMVLDFNTLLPNNDLTRYSFFGGAFVEIIFFTLLLTNKYLRTTILNKTLTEQKKELERTKIELTKESITDSLSGLYNRRYFSVESNNAFIYARENSEDLSLLLMDLDKFKRINDTHGHQVGDLVIRSTSEIIKSLLRNDDMAARYGGEEFIVLLPRTTLDEAIVIAQRIREKIQNYEIELEKGSILKTTISIGVSGFKNESGESIEDVIRSADRELYKSKANGRNLVMVS